MLAENLTSEGEELFAYVVASGDMRFIEISRRALFLRFHPELGRIIRGEVPECGPACHANMSQVLLEYVMSCGDCHESARAAVEAERFGGRVAQELIKLYHGPTSDRPGVEILASAVTLVLNSMPVPFTFHHDTACLRFFLAFSPLHAAATKGGLNVWLPLAQRAFISLLQSLKVELAPSWQLATPTLPLVDETLTEIKFVRKQTV